MSSKKNIIIPMGMPPQKQEALCCQRIGTLGLLYKPPNLSVGTHFIPLY
jgi:hypothetical protein